MAKGKKSGKGTYLVVGLLVGAGAMFMFKDRLKSLISQSQSLRARRRIARRAMMRRAYVGQARHGIIPEDIGSPEAVRRRQIPESNLHPAFRRAWV